MVEKNQTSTGKLNHDKKETTTRFDEERLENNKKAHELYCSARRFMNLNELELALETIDEAFDLNTTDDDDYNKADAYFLAAQICRRVKDYDAALEYIENAITSVNPYREDSPKFALAKGVILLQLIDTWSHNSKRKKKLAMAIESFKMAITVSEVLMNQKVEYRFGVNDIATIKKYHQIAIFDIAYAYDFIGNRRAAIESLDRLFELYPSFSVEKTSFRLYSKIRDEKRVMHIAK